MMPLQEVPPRTVAELDGPFARLDDVGEEDCGEHSVGLAVERSLSQTPSRNDLISFTDRSRCSPTGTWRDPGSSSMRAPTIWRGHPAPSLDRDVISLAVHDQRRRLNRGKDVANVDLLVDEAQRAHSTRGDVCR